MEQFDIQNEENLTGRILIEASAGTGKTFTLSLLVVRLLIEQKLTIDQIVAVTFTKAATGELKERIGKFLTQASQFLSGRRSAEKIDNSPLTDYLTRFQSDEDVRKDVVKRVDHAIMSIDEAPVFTIHSFCHRLNSDFAFETRAEFSRELTSDISDIITEIRNNFWRKNVLTLPLHQYQLVVKSSPSPEKLHEAIQSALNFSEITLENCVEELPSIDKIAQLSDAKESLCVEISDQWKLYRDEMKVLIDELRDSKKISGGTYRATFTTTNFEHIDTYIATSGNPPSKSKGGAEYLNKLSHSGMKMNKGAEPSTHPFSIYLDIALPTLFDYIDKLELIKDSVSSWIMTTYFNTLQEQLVIKKEMRNISSFDDIITTIYNVLQEDSDASKRFIEQVQKRYPVALVDEFQDTDSQQYFIFNTLFGGTTLFMIGDPKQAIYRFRGGDVYAYLAVKQSVDLRMYTLSNNFRSEAGIIRGLNTIFSTPHSEDTFISKGIPYHNISSKSNRVPITQNDTNLSPIVIWECEEKTKSKLVPGINNAMVGEIVELLSNSTNIGAGSKTKRVSPSDMAILVSGHKEANTVKQMLSQVSIPAVTIKSGDIYKSDEASVLFHLLSAIHTPSNRDVTRALLFHDLFGFTIKEIEETQLHCMARFETYRTIWLEKGLLTMADQIFEREQLIQKILSKGFDGYRSITNFRHLLELLNTFEQRDGILPERLLNEFSNEMAETHGEECEQRLETDEEAVQIMTIHASKGLEFPILFVPYPWALISDKKKGKNFPIFHNEEELYFSVTEDEDRIAEEIQELNEENQRLFYVALTRASQRLYLTSAPKFMASGKTKDKGELIPTRRFIEPLSEMSDETISFLPLPQSDLPQFERDSSFNEGVASQFTGTISRGEITRSYSSMMLTPPHEERNPDPVTPEGIFAFQKGARTGEAWHRIFENITYTNSSSYHKGMIRALEEYGFTAENCDTDSVFAMTNHVMEVQLNLHNGEPFTLNSISRDHYETELEFLLQAENIVPATVNDIILEGEGIEVSVKPNQFSGYLTGFIDLLAIHNDHYFVIDWKSNHLGNSLQSYTSEAVASSMKEHEYRLQYILYIVALTALLRNRIPDFSYEQHIGGAYYFFLRGIKAGERTGLYFSKPKESTITKLLAHFLGEES